MTRLNAASAFDIQFVGTSENPLLTPKQAPRPAEDQPVDLFSIGIHEAVITITNVGDAKEQVEEIYLARQNHLRNGERITLNERADADVLHIQFHSIVSVQAVLADMKHRGLSAEDFRINWAE